MDVEASGDEELGASQRPHSSSFHVCAQELSESNAVSYSASSEHALPSCKDEGSRQLGHSIPHPSNKRADGFDKLNRPRKKLEVTHQQPQIPETIRKPTSAANRQAIAAVNHKHSCARLSIAKTPPESYNIRCYSLPLSFISKDFLKSPVDSAPKLQIRPLDITAGLFSDRRLKTGRQVRSETCDHANKPSKTEEPKDNMSHVATSLSQLHHSATISAFQNLDSPINLQAQLQKTKAQPIQSPAVLPGPTQTLQTQKEQFSDAFQEAIPGQRRADHCTANRKAAILRFKAKRLQRSFGKKVRYASRKRLADERPRVKGQFVKATDFVKADAK